MNRRTHTIRRLLAAVALSAAAALLVVPLAQARDTQVDDWFRGSSVGQPQSSPADLTGDFMFRDYLRNASKAAIQTNDHILDVSARGNLQPVPSGDHVLDVSARDTTKPASSGRIDLRGDFMFRDYLLSAQTAAAQANDHILDVSARDNGIAAPAEASPSGGTDWQKVGIDVGLGIGGALVLVALLVGVIEVRHTRHRLGSA